MFRRLTSRRRALSLPVRPANPTLRGEHEASRLNAGLRAPPGQHRAAVAAGRAFVADGLDVLALRDISRIRALTPDDPNIKPARQELLRGVLEGVVFNHRWHVDALATTVEVIDAAEAGARGAAPLAGVGAGVYRDLDDAVPTRYASCAATPPTRARRPGSTRYAATAAPSTPSRPRPGRRHMSLVDPREYQS